MSTFGVTPAELATARSAVGSAAVTARHAVDRLRASAADLQWHGPAAGAYRLAWQQWLTGAGLVLEALDELARLVGDAGTSYAATDESVRAAVAGVPG